MTELHSSITDRVLVFVLIIMAASIALPAAHSNNVSNNNNNSGTDISRPKEQHQQSQQQQQCDSELSISLQMEAAQHSDSTRDATVESDEPHQQPIITISFTDGNNSVSTPCLSCQVNTLNGPLWSFYMWLGQPPGPLPLICLAINVASVDFLKRFQEAIAESPTHSVNSMVVAGTHSQRIVVPTLFWHQKF